MTDLAFNLETIFVLKQLDHVGDGGSGETFLRAVRRILTLLICKCSIHFKISLILILLINMYLSQIISYNLASDLFYFF